MTALAAAPEPDIAVSARGIVKRFGHVEVLHGVDLDLRAGEVHALVGENGAGKSTLGRVIGGIHRPDGGALTVFGRRITAWDPKTALDAGIAMIHQELSLVPGLTVAENVFLGQETARAGVLAGDLGRRFAALEARCRFGLPADAPVGDLRIADRQKVEILRALARRARVIIMDEPTSSLTVDETARLHAVIAWLKREGCTIVYVTHFLDHVFETCDRVTVLRDGSRVRTAEVGRESKASLVEAMLGRPLDIAFPPRPPAPPADAAPLLAVEHLATATGVRDVSLVVRPGEIVGLLGLVGSGRSEIARAIFGADPPTGGRILVDGRPYDRPSPERSVARGLAMIPEDRRRQGLVLTQRVRPNVTLPHLAGLSRAGVLAERRERRVVRSLIERLGVVPPRVDGAVTQFSGGNQQKVLFAKWMLGEPRIVLLDEPTRGVDVGAKRRIYEIIVDLAARGAAVLLIASEHEEILGLAHRGYLVQDGRTLGEIDTSRAALEDVLRRLFA